MKALFYTLWAAVVIGQKNDYDTSCQQVNVGDFDNNLPSYLTVFSGYLWIREPDDSALAFIFYGSKKATSRDMIPTFPTVIWLSGGPGRSSFSANYLEIGPVIVDDQGNFVPNPNSWINEYNVMFIDQPIGTGYSYADSQSAKPTMQERIATQFDGAMQEFFRSTQGCIRRFQLDALTRSPWFIFGEGYAGKYIPYIVNFILQQPFLFSLKGIGIQNGFVDPSAVISEIPNYAYNMGLIDYQERQRFERAAMNGVLNIFRSEWAAANKSFGFVCDSVLKASGKTNRYNIFEYNDYQKQFTAIEDYLNRNETKRILGFNQSLPFILYSSYESLEHEFMIKTSIKQIESVLQWGIGVLIYNGQNDLQVPNSATLKWVYNLKFLYTDDFQHQDFKPWILQNKIVGYVKAVGSLEFRIVNNAGHFVHMDQPEAGLNMIVNFIDTHKDW